MPVEKKDVVVQPGTGDPMQGTSGDKALTPVRKDGGPARRGHLERGWVKHRLLRDFALGEKNQGELAEMYGCSRTAINQFKSRHALEIEEIRNNLADEYAGVWVAQKMNRILEYQAAAEKMANGTAPRNQEVLVSILKAVAEELGQLPARSQTNVQADTVVYQVVGVPVEDLT
jgi:hypothetical protein